MAWELALMAELRGGGGESAGNSLKTISLIATASLFACFTCMLFKFVSKVLWRPYALQKIMAAQGAKGPPYRPFYGNVTEMTAFNKAAQSEPMELSHDIIPRALPYYHHWVKAYGKPLLFWFGWKPRLHVTDPELIKEVLSNKFGHFQKLPVRPFTKELGGTNGLLNLEGERWAHHRRILNPAFHVEILKGMIPTMVECTTAMLTRWNKLLASGQKEVEMQAEFRSLTTDVISGTAFGSSHEEGHKVFKLQQELTGIISEIVRSPYIPGFRFLPTPKNIRKWGLDREIRKALTRVVKRREKQVEEETTTQTDRFGKDLLGIMISANRRNLEGKQRELSLSIDDIMDECKIFYFAGYETTSVLLTWTMMLLGVHTEWQEQAREEVFQVCGTSPPDPDTINNLKLVGMVLNESLRLYPPATAIFRQTYKTIKLGDMVLPEGIELVLMVIAAHHDKSLWGSDVSVFNPMRFAQGVSRAAKVASAFVPFSVGPRVCIGQNFALMEAKIALAMILQHFSFVISPAYRHAPFVPLTVQPQFGLQVLLEPLNLPL